MHTQLVMNSKGDHHEGVFRHVIHPWSSISYDSNGVWAAFCLIQNVTCILILYFPSHILNAA